MTGEIGEAESLKDIRYDLDWGYDCNAFRRLFDETIEDLLAARIHHFHAEHHLPRARGDLPQEAGGEFLRSGKRVVVSDVDDVRLVAGDDQVVKGRGILEAVKLLVEVADVPLARVS